MAQLLVVGGISLDVLHIRDQKVLSAGGAGVYSSMAAMRCGVKASILAPRPDPMPEELTKAAKRFSAWFGPVISPSRLPQFEIEHKGDRANYLNAKKGAEGELSVHDLPAELREYDCVHVTPLGDSKLQHEFIRFCGQHGARLISAGTYLCTVKENSLVVRQSIAAADVFFMNEEEACVLFGSLDQALTLPGKLLFITMGRQGCVVVRGNHQTRLNAVAAKVVDPTGAGDTFCGAVLAGLIRGEHPLVAAQQAMTLAALEIEAVGPAALFQDDLS